MTPRSLIEESLQAIKREYKDVFNKIDTKLKSNWYIGGEVKIITDPYIEKLHPIIKQVLESDGWKDVKIEIIEVDGFYNERPAKLYRCKITMTN